MSLKEIGNGTLSQNRHCDALVDERELQTSSSRVMAQRCVDLSLSLCVCVCFSLLCVFATDTFWSREEVGSFFSYIFEIGKKKESDENPKNAPIGWGKICTCALRARLSFVLSCTTNTKRLTT